MPQTKLQDPAEILERAQRARLAGPIIVEELEAAGWVIVPAAATEEMILSGQRADGPSTFKHENYGAWLAGRRGVEKRWRAMLGARPGK